MQFVGAVSNCRLTVALAVTGSPWKKTFGYDLRVESILHMRNTPVFLLLICTFLLSACRASQAESSVEEAPDNPGAHPTVVALATPVRQVTHRPTPAEAMPEPQPSPTVVDDVGQPEARRPVQLCSPLQGFTLEELPEIVSAPYAPPPPGREERHHGVDFSFYQRGERASIEGVGVQTVLAGKVAEAIRDRFPYGNMVIVETPSAELSAELKRELQVGEGESLYLLYAHMAGEPGVEIGAVVVACFPLGSVGKSGNAGVAHLHLETRLGPAGTQFSSMAYYTVQSTQEERDNYALWRTSGVFRHFDPMNLLTQISR